MAISKKSYCDLFDEENPKLRDTKAWDIVIFNIDEVEMQCTLWWENILISILVKEHTNVGKNVSWSRW
jgi:hypothetical protein